MKFGGAFSREPSIKRLRSLISTPPVTLRHVRTSDPNLADRAGFQSRFRRRIDDDDLLLQPRVAASDDCLDLGLEIRPWFGRYFRQIRLDAYRGVLL